jgi:hypothetical protein
MNYVVRVVTLLFASCSPHFLYGADKHHNFDIIEWLFKCLVPSEIGAEHANPYAWRIDSTKTIAVLACINKKGKERHKQSIAALREALMRPHRQNFDAVHLSSFLSNRYAQFCCLVSEEEQIKALFGVVESQHSIFTVRPWRRPQAQGGTAEPEHISSTTITYHNAQQQKIVAPAFQIMLNTVNINSQVCIILPEEKQRYILYLLSYHYVLPSFTPTFNKIIAAIFELSEDPTFWHYSFKKNGIQVKREVSTVDILIDLNDSYFKDAYSNITTLRAIEKSFIEDPCSCGTNHIDNTCKEKYETVCKILAEEGATHLKHYFLTHFFERHILHQIGYIQAGNHTKTIYINPTGTIFTYTPHNNKLLADFNRPANTISNLSLDSLQAAAATHANKWRAMGNLLLRNGTKKIDYYSYDTLDNTFLRKNVMLNDKDEEIVDGITVQYKKNAVPIFVLQTASKQTKLLFGSNVVNAYTDSANDQSTLKKGLARILFEKDPLSHIIGIPEQEIATFMHFIKKVENPIKNLRDIYPNFNNSYYSTYYPFSN